MDLSDPMRAVVPTLDGPVLRVLAGTSRPLTGREVHRLAQAGSQTGVLRVLHRLVEQGLVTVTEAGSSTLYAGNRDHLAWPAVETLAHLHARFWERVADLLNGWDPAPVVAGVFGSAARGDGSATSDIDVLLVRPTSLPSSTEDSTDPRAAEWAAQVDRLRDALHTMTGNRVQIMEMSDREMHDLLLADDPLIESLRRDLRVLVGDAPWQRSRSGRLRQSLAAARQ